MSDPLFVSIALCSYNGARYLQEQLDSIAGQSRLPDELVVCDDRSLDETAEIIRAFASKVSFPVRLTINERNLGSTKNFEKAVSLCRGDIILLSDQDDVWREDKIMRFEIAFVSAPSVGAVFSDAEVVDEHLRPMGYHLWESITFSPVQQKRLIRGKSVGVLLKHNVVTGATLAFRGNFKGLVLPIAGCWQHDGWIALLIAASADLSIIGEPLIKYRQHSKNQIGAVKLEFSERLADAQLKGSRAFITYIDQLETVRDRILEFGHPPNKDVIGKLESKLLHLQARGNLPEQRLYRLPKVINELLTLRYFLYSNGVPSIARDLFL
jgi:glycosyltransferase involved in cell wall biosynthesis